MYFIKNRTKNISLKYDLTTTYVLIQILPPSVSQTSNFTNKVTSSLQTKQTFQFYKHLISNL